MAVVGEWSGDPADVGPASLTNRALADFLFEGLSRLDALGRPEAALAERWFVSDDRLTWTFVLPDGLTDGLGEPLTARDVKQSLGRVAARGPADQAAIALTAVMGWTDRMNGDAGGVAGISAPDETTLVIRLSAPFELLPAVLASPPFGISGATADGTVRTTGAYRYGDDPDVLVAVSDTETVGRIELVRTDGDPTDLIAAGRVDWAVLPPGALAEGLPADVIRQPLELDIVLVARFGNRDERLGLLAIVEPLLLATEVEALSPRVTPRAIEAPPAPDAALVDVPLGILASLGEAIVAQLEDAGLTVVAVLSSTEDFAARVASGDAVLFPAVVAGGMGSARGILRFATPGAVDDFFGPASEVRTELAAAVAAETDPDQRALFIDALERVLIDDGLLLPIGRFEVRVAVGNGVPGLRHRVDGTVELSGVTAVS